MNKIFIVVAICATSLASSAAWYWPFGGKGDDVSRARISELMEPVSVLIDQASDDAEAGKINEAVEEYRKALRELDRIEVENPDRVGTAEFATVNNKRAYVDAAIDSLLLKQAQRNAKAVALTDTTELEKKYARLKGRDVPGEKPAATNAVVEAASHRADRNVPDPISTRRDSASAKKPSAETAPAKSASAASPERERIKTLLAVNPRDRKARLRLVMEDFREKDYDAAKLTIRELLAEKPNDAAALNLRAAIETEQGDYKAAENTLAQSMTSNPRSHYAYYNMARLVITTRGASGKSAARRYYETGRTFGGPVDTELEGLLK